MSQQTKYYCGKCGHWHVRGNIYTAHKQFALGEWTKVKKKPIISTPSVRETGEQPPGGWPEEIGIIWHGVPIGRCEKDPRRLRCPQCWGEMIYRKQYKIYQCERCKWWAR